MSADRVLRSAEFSSPDEYLRSLPETYTTEDGAQKPVPFMPVQMGVMQGFVDGLSENDIGESIGKNEFGVRYTFRELMLRTERTRQGFSPKRRAFVFAIEHDLLDLSLVKPHNLGSLELSELKIVNLISRGATDSTIMQVIGMIDEYEAKEFNKKRSLLEDSMKALFEKLGLVNEFQLIALGIAARRKSEETQ